MDFHNNSQLENCLHESQQLRPPSLTCVKLTTCACETNRAINIIIIYDCIILYFHSVALFTDYYLNYGIASLFAAIGIYSAAMLGAITIWAVVSLSKLLIESSMLRP